MKHLFLVRHAKSSWSHRLPDRERPLARRGKRDAPKMAKRLAKRQKGPDLIVSSPAARALATARRMARELDYRRKDIEVDPRLYPMSARRLLEVVRGLDDACRRVMLVGHNPGMESFSRRLSGTIGRMPTAAIAAFKFDVKCWAQVNEAALISARLDYPKSKKRARASRIDDPTTTKTKK